MVVNNAFYVKDQYDFETILGSCQLVKFANDRLEESKLQGNNIKVNKFNNFIDAIAFLENLNYTIKRYDIF